MKNRVAEYRRVSTLTQAENGYGLASQKSLIHGYIKKNKCQLIATYEDPGVTGSTIDRPGLLKLLDDAKKNMFDFVLVAKMDRLARDLYIQLWIEKELKKCGVEIISVQEPELYGANDPMTVAFRQMIGVFAHLEKNVIVARLKSGRTQKAMTGGKHSGKKAYGYDIKGGQYVINKEEAEVVKTIFRMFAEGKSLGQIVKALKNDGLKSKSGKEFQINTVKGILHNQNYIGNIRFNNEFIQGSHDPIVSKVMFGKARKRLTGK